jgi:hypothetical protein
MGIPRPSDVLGKSRAEAEAARECHRSGARARDRLVLVRAERVRRGAGVADRGGRLEVAEGDRYAAVGQEALDVVEAVLAGLDLDQAPERAALDPLRSEPVRLRIWGYNRQRQSHRVRLGLDLTWTGRRSRSGGGA